MHDESNPVVELEESSNGDIPENLPLLMLSDQVVFPRSVAPLRIESVSENKLVDDVANGDKFLAVVALRDHETEEPGLKGAFEVGCVCRIVQVQHMSGSNVSVVIQALRRFRIRGLVQRKPYLVIRAEVLQEPEIVDDSLMPYATSVKLQMTRLIGLTPNIPEGAVGLLENISHPGFLTDVIAGNLNISLEEKQRILETLDFKRRLERLMYLLAREIELMEVSTKIQDDVQSSIDKTQREFFLRQQLRAIQDELGDTEEGVSEADAYRRKIEALQLPEEALKEALREVNRLQRMNEASAEYHVVTTYLDWLVDMPWSSYTDDLLDIPRAQTILDEDHYGLAKVKKRILEYLAVRKLKPDASGPILCFVGPPGVGKTSLGKSIARALGRRFVRMSLGGMRDEAEIRGHRKTYVGALPGRIIQSIRKAGFGNPVFMLDEIDKVGSDFRGDPSSALLEVLDPAQNDTFADHYLNVNYDLSKVMFIATANVLDTVPWALRDRMEVIEIPGYTLEEKLQIARKYLVPRQLEAHGLASNLLFFTAGALRGIIASYTREAGVRNLEREIANVCRACARKFAEGHDAKIRVEAKALREFLGNERVFHDAVSGASIPGVAMGLAWTPTGGDILFIEVTRMPGKGELILTGQLGDVMKESARTVLSYVRSNAATLALGDVSFSDHDIHIHVPHGAVPKDGPSAGVAILTALASLLIGKAVRSRLAMTGEVTLRGLVLPVGGVREKVLAAVRAGIKEIILPARCRNDLDDVPQTVKKKVRFHFVEDMHEVLAIALGIRF